MKEELVEKIENKIEERKTINDLKKAFVKEVNNDIVNKAEENLEKIKTKTDSEIDKIKSDLEDRKTINDLKVAFVKEINKDISTKVEEDISELKNKIKS